LKYPARTKCHTTSVLRPNGRILALVYLDTSLISKYILLMLFNALSFFLSFQHEQMGVLSVACLVILEFGQVEMNAPLVKIETFFLFFTSIGMIGKQTTLS